MLNVGWEYVMKRGKACYKIMNRPPIGIGKLLSKVMQKQHVGWGFVMKMGEV